MLPKLLAHGGPMLWVILFAGAVGIVVFIERFLHCHRAQINSTEFLNGVRTVIKRDNLVEAISICDATPGPVSRLVKTAILNRDFGRERVRESLEEAGLAVAIPLHAGYNYLVSRVNAIVLDMERAANEIVSIVTENGRARPE